MMNLLPIEKTTDAIRYLVGSQVGNGGCMVLYRANWLIGVPSGAFQKFVTMRNFQNSQDIIQKVNPQLDNLPTPGAKPDTSETMTSDTASNDHFDKESSFQEFIRSNIHRKQPAPSLLQSIKDQINKSSQNGHSKQ